MADLSSSNFGERSYFIVLVVCTVLSIGVGLLWSPNPDEDLSGALPGQTMGQGFTTSATCQSCHPDQYDSWHRSYHRTMTQVATPSSVLGRFDDVVLEDRGYIWRLERRGDEFWIEMPDPLWFNEPAEVMLRLREDWPESPPRFQARVVMTTGSHHFQNYWIRRPDTMEGALAPDSGALVQVPWVWLIQEGKWIPNQDSFLRPPSSDVQGVTPWNATCSQCHSVGTEPQLIEHLGRYETQTVELGIACEACHGPGAEHVRFYQSPAQRYLGYFSALRNPNARDPTIVNPKKLNARRSVEVCAQCHSFGEWTDQREYGSTGIPFRPGDELGEHRSVFRYTQYLTASQGILSSDLSALEGNFWADGTIRVAGREYNGLLEDAHFESSELTCLTCHSMHDYQDPDAQLDPEVIGSRACLGCHTEFSDRSSEHTRHLPESSGSECMNCHMPHTTYGLFSAMRSHRIDSPSVRVSVESGRPNACNLCHLDKTLDWSNQYLNEWYGQPLEELGEDERSIAASVMWVLAGDAVQRTILAWHLGWEVAQDASGGVWMAAYLAQLLTDPYSATRQVAYRSIIQMTGFNGFRYNYLAPRLELEERATRATEIWLRLGGGLNQAVPHLLIGDNQQINVDDWLRLLAGRDQRPLVIVE